MGFEIVAEEYVIEDKHRPFLTEEIRNELPQYSEKGLLMTGMFTALRKPEGAFLPKGSKR